MTMKITEMDRGHLQIEEGDKSAIIESEMLFVDNETRLGFTVYLYTMNFWTSPGGEIAVTPQDRARAATFLEEEFRRKDRYLDLVLTP